MIYSLTFSAAALWLQSSTKVLKSILIWEYPRNDEIMEQSNSWSYFNTGFLKPQSHVGLANHFNPSTLQ
jgi:hypothetical protein